MVELIQISAAEGQTYTLSLSQNFIIFLMLVIIVPYVINAIARYVVFTEG